MMDEAGFLPTSIPPRRWEVGAGSPVTEPLHDIPAALLEQLKECVEGQADVLPPGYGDPSGLWVTVRSGNPFHILLLDATASPSAETLLVRFRLLWKFWNQKATIARQGATRAVMRQKYGESIESYIDNLQWAFDQLSTEEGVAFWRKSVREQRAQMLWARVQDMVDATLADGMLEIAETRHLISRAELAGYEREEFAGALRNVLYARGFESESMLKGCTESERLASARWATPEVWARLHAAQSPVVPATMYYVRVQQTTLGPMTTGQVEELIRTRRVDAGDGLCIVGAPVWQAIELSQFAQHFRAQVTPCPRCGHALAISTKPIRAGVVVLVIGIVTAVVYVGLPLIIIGVAMIAVANKARWHCTQCGYWS